MKEKKRATSKITTCEVCGKAVFIRGLKSHIRLAHHMKLNEVVTQVIERKYLSNKGDKVELTQVVAFREETKASPTKKAKRTQKDCPHGSFLKMLDWHVENGFNTMKTSYDPTI